MPSAHCSVSYSYESSCAADANTASPCVALQARSVLICRPPLLWSDTDNSFIATIYGIPTNTIHPAWRSRCSLAGRRRSRHRPWPRRYNPVWTMLHVPSGGWVHHGRSRRRRCEASRAQADARGRSPGAAAKAQRRHRRVTDLSPPEPVST